MTILWTTGSLGDTVSLSRNRPSQFEKEQTQPNQIGKAGRVTVSSEWWATSSDGILNTKKQTKKQREWLDEIIAIE